MSTTIIMPQLGESVAEGIIGKWLKQQGDPVGKDEPIVEVITDKVNAEIPSPVAGVLEQVLQPEGATVAVGEAIAVIGGGEGSSPEAGGRRQEVGAATGSTSSNGQGGSVAPAPVAQTAAVNGPSGATPTPLNAAPASDRAERVRSSPLVRRLAEEYGISLADVPGTGIGGRVSKNDILQFVEHRQQAASQPPVAVAPAQAPAIPATPSLPPQPGAARSAAANEELIPISPLRKMIAERMVISKYTIPHAMTNADVDMTPVVRYRDSHKDTFRQREGVSLSLVAFAIKATVEALKEFPLVNAEWGGDTIILKHDININVAVDAPDGLITPVIQHADSLSLAGLSKAITDLATRAREKKLRVEDMQGGTFTVNNTGALGSVSGFSIINYPQAGILSTGAIVKKPVVLETADGDTIAIRSMMNLSFSFDHRLLDGGYAARFVNAVKAKLEGWPRDYPLY